MPKPKILIIDDEPIVLDSIEMTLKGEGYELLFCTDPMEGLDLFRAHKPLVILLDLKIPGMSGTKFLSQIQLSAESPTAVIMLTGHGDDPEFAECFKLGATGFVKKPFGVYELKGIVQAQVALKQEQLARKWAEQDLSMHQEELRSQNEELRETQQGLQEALFRYSDLYDFAPVGYLTIGPKGLITQANLTATEMLGVGRKMLPNLSILNFVAPEFHGEFLERRSRIVETGEKRSLELKMFRKEQVPFWAHVEMSIEIVGDRDETQYRMAVVDITERKQIDEELKTHRENIEKLLEERTSQLSEEQKKFESLIEMLPLGLAITDPQGRLDYCNSAMLKMTGYVAHELKGRLVADFLDPKSQTIFFEHLQSGVTPEPFEGSFRGKGERCIHLRIFPGDILAGDPSGPSLFAVVEEITAQR